MFAGGMLIRRFDGFRRLCAHAGRSMGSELILLEQDLLVINRTLAALGGPPAAGQVEGSLRGDSLPLLLLFLLTQELPVRIGLIGPTGGVLARLKALTHVLGHAVWPVLSSEKAPRDYQEVVGQFDPTGVRLHTVIRYDGDGEPVAIDPAGAAASLEWASPSEGQARWTGDPFTLVVIQGDPLDAQPPPLGQSGVLHPAMLRLTGLGR